MTPLPLGGAAGLDDPLAAPSAAMNAAVRRDRRWGSRRLALGLSPIPRAGLALLLAGAALGPRGLGVLSESVLGALDPVVSMAFAALGVLAGLEIAVRPPREGRLLAAASLESAVTILMVGAGMATLYWLSSLPKPTAWLLALMLGICAAPSSTAADAPADPRRALATRVGELDDVLPLLLAGLAAAFTMPGAFPQIIWLIGQGILISAAIAIAVWLLITRTSSESEQRVFVIGALLLVGGAATHLALSALFLGLIAGVVWRIADGPAFDDVVRDMRYLQHPLMVLLLVVAGAKLQTSMDLAGLVAAYVVLRIAGKLLGAWLAGRAVMRELPRDLGLALSSPGVVGVAIALEMLLARGASDTSAMLFTIVVLGFLGSEVLSVLIVRREGRT
ncbi:MAG: hypothetical protein HY655_00100 [Acidobacteria bacterium]|nr:hypothetical protein [Acidobacteriota bacterium]